jgi:hypothetical protein
VVCVNGEISAMHIQYGAKLAENLNNWQQFFFDHGVFVLPCNDFWERTTGWFCCIITAPIW